MNIAVLRGRLARPAEHRVLPSGDRLTSVELSVRHDERATETVPVVWFDPPAAAESLDHDQEVVVIGRVRRRFFRAGGSTQSRTEVVAELIVPARRAKQAQAALAKARARLESG